MAKLWDGRFSKQSSKLLEDFNASIGFDYKLWREDIAGSKAHARMLNRIGVLESSELEAILNGLDSIALKFKRGEFTFDNSDEDIHMARLVKSSTPREVAMTKSPLIFAFTHFVLMKTCKRKF